MSAPTQSFISYSFIFTVPDNFKIKNTSKRVNDIKLV